jgi:hypothetical protein
VSYRITNGDTVIECDTESEFSHVYKVLTDENVPIPGGPPKDDDECAALIGGGGGIVGGGGLGRWVT